MAAEARDHSACEEHERDLRHSGDERRSSHSGRREPGVFAECTAPTFLFVDPRVLGAQVEEAGLQFGERHALTSVAQCYARE